MARKTHTGDEAPMLAPDLSGTTEGGSKQKAPAIKDLPMRRAVDDHPNFANAGLQDFPEGEEAQKKAAARTLELARKVAKADIPGSMRNYIVAQALPDEEADRMISAWKQGRVVRHGEAQWGDEAP